MVEVSYQLEAAARLLLAALLGASIGFERELRGYPAGVRTFTLVSLGAALFSEVSRVSGVEDRIAAGIVSGIGFIGAGVILREGGAIRGVTTAATIWASAAVGMAVAEELFLVAVFVALGVFLLLESRPLVRRLTEAVRVRLPGAGHEEDGEP